MTNCLMSLRDIINSSNFNDQFLLWASDMTELVIKTKNHQKLIAIFGNGGSAADAQHWAAELSCTYRSPTRQPYPALALTTDSSILTAWSNDFDFSTVFQRQVEAYHLCLGLAIGMSTSGKSKNILYALDAAKSFNSRTVLISGSSPVLHEDYDIHIRFPSTDTPTIQTLTQLLYHEVCQNLEKS